MDKKIEIQDLANMVENIIKQDKVDERLSIVSKNNIDKVYYGDGSNCILYKLNN